MSYLEKMCQQTGYTPITNLWELFTNAENIGELSEIKTAYDIAFKSTKDDYKQFTELVMFLNWKCWEWYYKNNNDYSEYYGELYYQADEYGLEHLKNEISKINGFLLALDDAIVFLEQTANKYDEVDNDVLEKLKEIGDVS